MRDELKEIVTGHFSNTNRTVSEIDFGYDCMNVTVECDEVFDSVSVDELITLQRILKSDLSPSVKADENGNIVVGYDITEMILEEFGDWKSYEKAYDF